MEGNFIGNFIGKIKNKFNNKVDYPHLNEYSFSGEEVDSLTKQNMEEIDKLRHGYVRKDTSDNEKEILVVEEDIEVKKDIKEENDIEEKNIEDKKDKDNYVNVIDSDKDIEINNDYEDYGYINLSNERRENIMKRWNSIDVISLSKDIEKGKNILEHNYIITYADDALAYIYKIRDEYDILIEYLIGFNNEKKGIYNKNIFSSKLNDEWKYLNSYIKILEKIKSAINR